jgi:hypothetical protein
MVTDVLRAVATLVINPLIVLGFVIATVYLFYAIVQLIWKADSGDLEKNKKDVMYAVIGLFIMFSVYGILAIVKATFKIP